MEKAQIISVLEECGAMLNGHFKLSSGLHSDTYIQCAKLLMYPNKAELLCKELAKKIVYKFGEDAFDLVVSPAMGGILVGFELSRHLSLPNIFCERVNGVFELRRGFEIAPGSRILVVEDVVTTGKSSIETYKLIETLGGKIIAEASLINRSKSDLVGNTPLISLINIDVPTYDHENLPDHLKGTEAVKPGSRYSQQ
ncbi:orotate phosphoribosyltransferase [Rickettsiales endosymbiont of Stachyamoeba lipophora]|uniref:orotate phosphoribosyltransferase n=1 Tax=Rickettsiales endosymbiont of Stachyamoeba lipophora TaxID=2486578 RepID=UPI000F648AF1|nr:orotate phosphoribosyltransferase [Rickettsiales endosymbiont of Stachyamoeba lipophora]AZL16305.1 orotate phosphoribosyltransferase [Rickettsiales endosymbiont of Stachyamoeba lipophora]